MGLNTWAAFIGADANAAIAGDVAMLASEVTPVLKVLRQNGLDVVAIHHHMLDTAGHLLSALLGHGTGRQAGDRLRRRRSISSARERSKGCGRCDPWCANTRA